MHPIIERTRYGVAPPLNNAERIAAYRQLIDETSEHHHERVARWRAFQAFFSRSRAADTARPAFLLDLNQ